MGIASRRRYAYVYLALVLMATAIDLVRVLGLHHRPFLGHVFWLPIMLMFPVIALASIAREQAAIDAGVPLPAASSRNVMLAWVGGAVVVLLLGAGAFMAFGRIAPAG